MNIPRLFLVVIPTHTAIFWTSLHQGTQLLFPFTSSEVPSSCSSSCLCQQHLWLFYGSAFLLFIFASSSCIYYSILFSFAHLWWVHFLMLLQYILLTQPKARLNLYRVQQGIIRSNRREVLLNPCISEVFHFSVNLEVLLRQSMALVN